MVDFFPDGPAHEYPQLINIAFSFLWAFVLASLIAITHRLTFTGEFYPKNFFQSLILGAVVTTMVMMAIGDSLARGLGVFGAMAIIRFRTRIDDPRDVLFLFAALSTGLAIGVFGYAISFVGALLFILVALFLYASPFRSFTQRHNLIFISSSPQVLEQVLKVIPHYCMEYRQVSVEITKDKLYRYHYGVALKKGIMKDHLVHEVSALEGITQVKLMLNELIAN
jgi:uncharacterized membrane protein YhiD involved in acid resistance